MIKILVAEDDKDLGALVKARLGLAGYDATLCRDGEEALEAFCGGSYDLVVTDVMMPRLDGFGLAERLREADANVPLLFMTALDDKPSKLLRVQAGHRRLRHQAVRYGRADNAHRRAAAAGEDKRLAGDNRGQPAYERGRAYRVYKRRGGPDDRPRVRSAL